MNETLLELILDELHRQGRAATYGAVAGVVGGTARNVMGGQDPSHRCSWVVAASSKLPTRYEPEHIDPRLEESIKQHGVIDTPEALESLELADS